MKRNRLLPVVLAVSGYAAVVIGLYQGLIHVAPGYEGTIVSGWGGELSHEEVLLGQVGAIGVGGTVAALRWKRLASVPIATGGIVLFYTLRAVFEQFQTSPPLYREFSATGGGFEGDTVMLILGAEPFLLAAGGVLLIGAGIARWQYRTTSGESDRVTSPSSAP